MFIQLFVTLNFKSKIFTDCYVHRLISTNASARDKISQSIILAFSFWWSSANELSERESIVMKNNKCIFCIKFWISFNIIIFTLFRWGNHLLFVEIVISYLYHLLSKHNIAFKKCSIKHSTLELQPKSELELKS